MIGEVERKLRVLNKYLQRLKADAERAKHVEVIGRHASFTTRGRCADTMETS